MSLRPSLQKRSVARHVKRISEVSMPEHSKDPDILNQLRDYRRQKSKNTVNDSSLSRTEKSLISYLRPGSAGNSGTIFSAIKTQELFPLHGQNDKKTKNSQVFIEQSVDRLYRGSRPQTQSIDLQKTALFQLAEVVCEKKVLQLEATLKAFDEKTHEEILNDFTYLKLLRFDLDLNWEIARGKDVSPNESRMGVYYALEDKLKKPPNIGPRNSFSLEPIVNELKECSRLFRDILRGIMTKGAEDEGILIEMLWKVLFNIIDKSLAKHEYSLNCVIECTKDRLKEINEKYLAQISKLNQEYQEVKCRLEKQVSTCLDQINTLTQEKNEFIRMVNEKSRTIVELTEVESQEKACVELRQLLNKLSSYITESESEQNKQVTTLNHLSFVIRAADILREKPTTSSEPSQTSIQISESFLPEQEIISISRYPLFPVLIKHTKVPPKYNALSLCSSAFEECDGSRQYYIELLMFLVSMYKDKESLFSNFRSIYHQLLLDHSVQAEFYLTLLNNSKKSHLRVEQNMFKLAGLFDKSSESGSMTILKIVEFLQTFLPEERNFAEEVLEKLTQNFKGKEISAVVDMRFAQVFEKVQKNVRSLVERDGVSLAEFVDWARNKVNFWATEKEIEEFFRARTGMPFNNWFVFESYEKVKEVKIEKENFLLAFFQICLKKISLRENFAKSVENLKEFQRFQEVVSKENPEISEKVVTNCFVEVLLGTSFDEVQEKVLEFDFNGLKISESPKPKRKGAKSPVKRGKK